MVPAQIPMKTQLLHESDRMKHWEWLAEIQRRVIAIRAAHHRLFCVLGNLLLFAAFFLLLRSVIPFSGPTEVTTDEGLNCIKALLIARGYRLYSQIWSDQPPFFSFLLAWWCRAFGFTPDAARVLIMLFGALLGWSVFKVVARAAGTAWGWVAMVFLLLSGRFLLNAGAVMIGLPALSLAMFSLWLAGASRRSRSSAVIVIAGVIFAMATLTKLMALLLLPTLLLELWRSGRLRGVLLWGVSYALSGIAIALLIAPDMLSAFWSQLLAPHLAIEEQQKREGIVDLFALAGTDYDLLALALLGVVLLAWQRCEEFAAPLLSFLVALIVLGHHEPVWAHHYLYLSVPMVILAALGVQGVVRECRSGGWLWSEWGAGKIVTACGVIALGWYLSALPHKVVRIQVGLQKTQMTLSRDVLAELQREKKKVKWMFTDRPMYAFVAGIPVPPEVSVLSWKRMQTSHQVASDIREALVRYQPEIVFIKRYPELRKELADLLEQRYVESRRLRGSDFFEWKGEQPSPP